jgi:hypothetical protein
MAYPRTSTPAGKTSIRLPKASAPDEVCRVFRQGAESRFTHRDDRLRLLAGRKSYRQQFEDEPECYL